MEIVAGAVAAPLGVILFAVAFGLQIDGALRRDALRRIAIDAGPGDLGLSLRLALDA